MAVLFQIVSLEHCDGTGTRSTDDEERGIDPQLGSVLKEVTGSRKEIFYREVDCVEQRLVVEHAGCFLTLHAQAIINGSHGEPLSEIMEVREVKICIPFSSLKPPPKTKIRQGWGRMEAESLW